MMSFDDLPLFRTSDPDTSAQGAKDVSIRRTSQAFALLATFRKSSIHGLTDEEAARHTYWKGAGSMYEQRICYWKRCSDLRAKGLIEPTGATRLAESGSMQMVSRITVEGVRLLREQ